MEELHRDHKDTAWDWLTALTAAAPRTPRGLRPVAPRFMVTPWSGRSPGGWSA